MTHQILSPKGAVRRFGAASIGKPMRVMQAVHQLGSVVASGALLTVSRLAQAVPQ